MNNLNKSWSNGSLKRVRWTTMISTSRVSYIRRMNWSHWSMKVDRMWWECIVSIVMRSRRVLFRCWVSSLRTGCIVRAKMLLRVLIKRSWILCWVTLDLSRIGIVSICSCQTTSRLSRMLSMKLPISSTVRMRKTNTLHLKIDNLVWPNWKNQRTY